MESKPCPRCGNLIRTRHCKFGLACYWRVCLFCTVNPYTLVFDPRTNHYYLTKVEI